MKKKKSKLDPFAEQLAQWDAEGLPLTAPGDCIVKRLAAIGCSVSFGRVSVFLSAQRRSALLEKSRGALFGVIRDASETNKQLDAQFKANPVPELSRLVEVTKVLVLDLKVSAVSPDGSVDQQKIELASTLLHEITEGLKLQHKEKELALKHGEAARREQELSLKVQTLELARDKFEFDATAAALAKLDSLKAIKAKSNLTEDQKLEQARLELFGVAPK